MRKGSNSTQTCITDLTAAGKHTAVGKAYQYYLKGLTARETGILLNVSERTVQRWKMAYRFAAAAQPQTLRHRAADMKKKGYSYPAIAKALQISRSTVYNYLKGSSKQVG